MFSKISRYRKLRDDVTIDPNDNDLESKSVRLLPLVTGKFEHIVEEVDRLDHLAFKYYKQSRNWWRFCDANPEFMSPQALLGKESVVTQRFNIEYNNVEEEPAWAELLGQLRETIGVEDVRVEEDIELVSEERELEGVTFKVNVEKFNRAVVITYNEMNIGIAELKDVIIDTDFEVIAVENIGRVGKKIVVPPPIVG
jgi:hypothetical protein